MSQEKNDKNKDDGFLASNPADLLSGGADELIARERASIGEHRHGDKDTDRDLLGLAISGGGIRSASFALGVIQALAQAGKLRHFDYLSTVSGGGYIGSSLTWLLHKAWPGNEVAGQDQSRTFGSNVECFPYASDSAPGEQRVDLETRRRLMRHLRQNASYLTPGNGISAASLSAVILRGMFVSFLVYFPLLVLIFYVFARLGGFGPVKEMWTVGFECYPINVFLVLAAGSFSLFMLSAFGYALMSSPLFHAAHWVVRAKEVSQRYMSRRRYERWTGYLLMFTLTVLVIGLVPWLSIYLGTFEDWNEFDKVVSGAVSLLTGGLFSGLAFKHSESGEGKKRTPTAFLMGLGALLMVYGVLLLSYEIADEILARRLTDELVKNSIFILFIPVFLLGWFTNINYLSIHRYYRDRLMETFLPSIPDGLADTPQPAKQADRAMLHDMWPRKSGPQDQGIAPSPPPYHLINCNLILTSSNNKKYKARGGDSFVFSPLYSGSSALGGWRRTEQVHGGQLSLATAMAISGAAANPHSGPSGTGFMRGRAAAFLMTLLNLRLGYWLVNPDQAPNKQKALPNLLSPGLLSLVGKGLDEEEFFIHLSDGGHFENLGVYELIRRQLRFVVCTDAAEDLGAGFADLANLVEKVRVDFGIEITGLDPENPKPDDAPNGCWKTANLDLRPLIPRERGKDDDPLGLKFADRGFLLCAIRYQDDDPGYASGLMLYIKTTWLNNMPADVVGYKRSHTDFPDQSTGDQFFDERQFEAYRQFGYELGSQALESDVPLPWPED